MASAPIESGHPLVTKDEFWGIVVPCVSFTFFFGLFCAYCTGTVLCYIFTVVAFVGTSFTTFVLVVIKRNWKGILFETLFPSKGPAHRTR